jgi:hypothetical protein
MTTAAVKTSILDDYFDTLRTLESVVWTTQGCFPAG